MGVKARQYRPSHIRRLDTLSGNSCSFPECERKLVARDGETIVSKICHIEAASDQGPRFNKNMSDDERRHFNNLILMCDECHSIIDNMENESKYPVSDLQQWKKDHHEKIESLQQSKLSHLTLAINAIASIDFDDNDSDNDSDPDVFNIAKKIEHNCIDRNLELIDEYKIYYPKIAALYAELESQGSFKKERLLRNIRRIYLKVIGNYTEISKNKINKIQLNADNIIEDIEEDLFKLCEKNTSPSHDDISFSISLIMVDAFMRCKILEEPPKK